MRYNQAIQTGTFPGQTTSPNLHERKVAEESPRRGVREGFVPLAEHLSKLTVVVSEEEEMKIERAKDLLSQKLQKPASLQETLNATVTLTSTETTSVAKISAFSLYTI